MSNLPKKMRAAVFYEYGPPSVLQVEETGVPKIKANQLLIKVHATSINPVDFKIREGKRMQFKLLLGFSRPKRIRILGGDIAGEVVEVGRKVKGFENGDRVFALVLAIKGGCYAQYIAVNASTAAHIPKDMPYEQAVGIPLAGHTAYQALVRDGNIKAGDKVLINGASGGVGTYAVQYAKVLGAHVTAVCSSRNIELVKSLGADVVIDYTKEDFKDNGEKYHIIYDVVNNQRFGDLKKSLEKKSTAIFTNLEGHLLRSVIFSVLSRKKAKLTLVKSSVKDLNYSAGLWVEGKLKTIIDSTFTLDEIVQSHERSESGRAVGKIIVNID